MHKLVVSVVFGFICVGLVLADSPKAKSADPADVEAVKAVEQSMGDAMVAVDIEKLSLIYADDFAAIGSSGRSFTKENLLSDFKSGKDKLVWFEDGPVDVQVFGNLALAQGSVKEKRILNGKDTSGESAWMDLLEKRAGKWVVVRSAGTRIVSAGSPKGHSQDPSVINMIKQTEQDIGNAMVAADLNKLDQMYADDWATIGLSSSEIWTKKNLLSDFKSGEHKLLSFENGPVENVQVFGNVALVQASVKEKRSRYGKDTSGEFIFMDLLEKREGNWVVVRTLAARVS